ncbi:hypothetical protein GCM10027277_51920 [Pseudoduganella ginsengisoli]|uniref:Lipoprotein n=1 Tax=Pseudoduganella ginsengisoli TaxID=1462440 RepID=A0A6L6Q577_9BURK|nr:hypothetical protein [Pseudoduganella ginsengisoli]MTW04411.1 hypothetical protein [Pseudoduganella ginsengisoli]
MKNIAAIVAIAVLLSACAAPTYYPTYSSPTTPTVTETAPDNDSGFSSEEEDRKADAAIASAQQTYASIQATTSSFSLRGTKCDEPAMAVTVSSLQSVDEVARRYIGIATTAPDPADREAAMDVLDELNKVVLDGLLDIAQAYRSRKCFPYAKHIITEAKRIYSGPAYADWVGAMDAELAAITAQEPVTPAMAKPITPAKSSTKKKAAVKKPQSL